LKTYAQRTPGLTKNSRSYIFSLCPVISCERSQTRFNQKFQLRSGKPHKSLTDFIAEEIGASDHSERKKHENCGVSKTKFSFENHKIFNLVNHNRVIKQESFDGA